MLKKLEYKMGLSFIKLLLARVKSKSPKFYVVLRKLAGVLALLCAGLVYVCSKDPNHVLELLSVKPDLVSLVSTWADKIGCALSGLFLFTWLGTSDPELANK